MVSSRLLSPEGVSLLREFSDELVPLTLCSILDE